MKLHASGEDYLEAVLVLQRKKGVVRSVDVPGHIHRAHHAFFLLEYQHGLQIILARRMEFFHRRDLFSIQ